MNASHIRPCTSERELYEAIRPFFYYLGQEAEGPMADYFVKALVPDRTFVGYDGEKAVAGVGSYGMTLSVPGGAQLKASAVTLAAVMPTHRRHGMLLELMQAELEGCVRRREPIACIWPSEEIIYERYGFGMTTFCAEIDVPREHTRFIAKVEPAGRFCDVPLGEARGLIAPIYAQVALHRPGMLGRADGWWDTRTLADAAWKRAGGGGKLCCVVYSEGETPMAYALYRIHFKLDHGVQAGQVEVVEAFGLTPPATAAIWRFLLDMDWTASIHASLLPLDHALLLDMAEPRRTQPRLRDGLWIRLLDVAAVLRARAYAPAGAIVIDVIDAQQPHNHGCWRIAPDKVTRTEQAPDLRCSASALASAYLGGFTWRQLVASMRAEALTPDADARADALFGSHPAPWCPMVF